MARDHLGHPAKSLPAARKRVWLASAMPCREIFAPRHAVLAGLAAALLLSIHTADRAYADGGPGGQGGFAPQFPTSRGSGGPVSLTNANTNGGPGGGSGGTFGNGGGGGGGGGTSGDTVSPGFGQGGTGGAGSNGAAGGAGATNSGAPGGVGANGVTFGDGGGGGGGGSGLFSAGSASFVIPGTLNASAGGAGGAASGIVGLPVQSNSTGGGGGGGNGGVGIILGTTAGSTLTVGTGVTINGGQGGAGGAGGASVGILGTGAGGGGNGGSGGFGALLGPGTTLINSGAINGGVGGAGGTSEFPGRIGLNGGGGVGLRGTGMTIFQNGGTIAGANGADAITFIGGGTITFNNGGATGLTGRIGFAQGVGASLTFAQGIGVDTTVGNVIGSGVVNNFVSIIKTGGDKLTLTAANNYLGFTSVNGGTLSISNASNIGNLASLGLLLGGGTLNTTASFALPADVTIGFTPFNFTATANTGAFTQTAGTALTLNGQVTGGGTLIQNGPGTLILGADNAGFTGNTLIQAGTLQLGNGGATGALPGNFVNNAALVINRTGTLALDGVLSGAGSLTQNGTVTTTLGGNSPAFTGASTVNGGAMLVNGFFGNSPFTVNAGGTLGGNGTVGSTTINGGVLSPGNSIGTLTVQGNLVLTAAATYMVEVSPSTADRTNVTGTANLGGATVQAVYGPGNYVSKRYTIVNATGGLGGSTFGALVNTNLPSTIKSSLSYDANNAYLGLELLFAIPGGLSGNQASVGNALTRYFNATGGIPLTFAALSPTGLTQASGEIATATQTATFDAMGQFVSTMTDPFVAGRSGVSSSSGAANAYAADDDVLAYARKAPEKTPFARMFTKAPPRIAEEPRWSVWAAGFGGSQRTDGQPVLGSNTMTSNLFGIAVGADYRLSPNTIAGFALAGGGTSFRLANNLGTGRSELFQAGGFIRHTIGNAYITAAAAYGWQDVTTDRTVTIAGIDRLRANFHSNALTGRIESGYRFVSPLAGGIGLTPYAAGQVTTIFLPSYAEQAISGANTFALAYASRDVTATRSELGLRADKSFVMQTAILTVRGRAAWAHNFNPDRSINATFQTLPGASFTVNGAAASRDTALTSASAEVRFLNNWSVAGTFEGEFSDRSRSYAGKGVVRYVW